MWAKIWKSREAKTSHVDSNHTTPEKPVVADECRSAAGEESDDLESLGEKEKGMLVHEDQTNSSFLHAVINMVGMLIGLGQLSTPYALQNGGWASSFLLLGLGAACTYSACLLGKCLQKNPKSRDYKDIGNQAFGSKGKKMATTFIYLEIFMALVSYTISLHDNLATVFAGVHLSSSLLATIAVLVALPTLWLRDLSSISFLSTAGILMSLLIFTTVVCTAAFGGVGAHQYVPVLNLDKIPAISGLYIFSFAGHIVFPNICTSMNDASKFTSHL